MEKLVQPEHEVCRSGWPAVATAVGGLLLVAVLSGWIVNVAMGAIAIGQFRELTLGTGYGPRGSSLPLFKLLGYGGPGGVNTTVLGPEEAPGNHPLVDEAIWATNRNNWDGKWKYYIGLAYWKQYSKRYGEILKKVGEIKAKEDEIVKRGRPAGEDELARMKDDKRQVELLTDKASPYKTEAFNYLLLAVAQDPANGFYRYTAMEMAEDTKWEADLEAKAESRVPGDTFVLLLLGERLAKQGKTPEALAALKRVLSYSKTEFKAGLVSDANMVVKPSGEVVNREEPAGAAYMGRAVDAMQTICKDYSEWQQYVPEDAEVHLRLGLFLQERSVKWKATGPGRDESGKQGTDYEWTGKVALAEQQKGIEAGERLLAAGNSNPLVMYLMGQAYRTQGDVAKGVEYMKKGLKLRPKETAWWLEVVKTDVAGAEPIASTKALRDDPKERAKASGYLDDAQEAVNRVVRLEPANSEILDLARKIQTLSDNLKQ